MNLTLHIVRKDLLRLRLWIVCWVALLLVPIAIGMSVLRSATIDIQTSGTANTLQILSLVQMLAACLMVVLLIQDDALVGTRQFWVTRPIVRTRLFAAKLLGAIVIFGFVPAMVSLPWWFRCGFTPGQMMGATVDILITMLIAIMPGALVATVTDSFARALLWTLTLVAVILVMVPSLGFISAVIASDRNAQWAASMRWITGVAIVAIELAMMVVAGFFFRRRFVLLVVGGFVMSLTMLFSAQLPLAWFLGAPPESHPDRAADITVRVADATASRLKPRSISQGVITKLAVGGLPGELLLAGGGAQTTWSWAGGTRIERNDSYLGDVDPVALPGLRPSVRVEREEKERNKAAAVRPGESVRPLVTLLPPSLIAKMRAEPPKFEAQLWWRVVRPELRVEVPLVQGGWVARNGHGLSIQFVSKDARGVTSLRFISTRPVTTGTLLRELFPLSGRLDPGFGPWFAVVDRSRGEIVRMFPDRYLTRSVMVNGVRIETHIRSDVPHSWNVPEPMGDTLAIVTMNEEAIFTRKLAVDRFELDP